MEAEVQGFIESRGYKEYRSPMNHEGERTFQLVIREDEGKRFINIHAWDLRSVRQDFGFKYDVESTFEVTRGNWHTMRFYGMSKAQLLEQLGELEGKVGQVFKLLGGVHQ